MEVAIRDAARHVGAEAAADQQYEPPVRPDEEFVVEADRLPEERVVLKGSVANRSATELDEDDEAQDAMFGLGEERLDHLPDPERLMRDVLVARLEVLESCFAWRVAQEDEHRNPEGETEQGGGEEQPPVLVNACVARSENRLENGGPEPHLARVRRRARGVCQRIAPVEREVDTERNHEPEERSERSTMANVKPRKLRGHDGCGAARLKEHVGGVEHEERWEDRDGPAELGVSVEHQAHEHVADNRTHDSE